MYFSLVAQSFEKIEYTSSRIEMTQILAQLLTQASPEQASIIAYLSLGVLQPPYIGTQFNLAQKSLIPVIAKLCDITLEQVNKELSELGDLGLVVQQYNWGGNSSKTVIQVYDELSALVSIVGTGSVEEKSQRLVDFLRGIDSLSAKFILRIIMGTLRLGFSDMTLIDALSWMCVGDKSLRSIIEDGYNRCADIGLIARVLKEQGIKAIKEMHVKVGIPIRPASAERLPSAAEIIKKIGSCVAQPKLDGFRLQIHLDKTSHKIVTRFFSRHLTDMSHMFPDLTKEVEKLNVQSLICEGEAIVFDPQTKTFLPFQETVKRKRKHGIEQAIEEFPLQVFLFDLLYLNGEELLNYTHVERRIQLLDVLKNYSGDSIQVLSEKSIDTVQELEKYFYENVSSGLEGIVVKRPNAIYQPGKRNFNWIKLKRQEEGHLEDSIDCVVLGYYFGAGKRAQFGIGAFLVGVYNKSCDCFETVAKVGTGLTDDEWRELKTKCENLKSAHQPNNVIVSKDLVPDRWVYPEIVTLIRADEITMSPVHSAGKTEQKLGYALRFPRFMGYRPDKSAYECTSVDELKRLYDDQFIK